MNVLFSEHASASSSCIPLTTFHYTEVSKQVSRQLCNYGAKIENIKIIERVTSYRLRRLWQNNFQLMRFTRITIAQSKFAWD
jgi:hypothetical protein